MAIDIKESFEVDVPVEEVWRLMMDPRRVSACMPGASLEEVIDERNFLGSVRVRVGAITAAYQGRVVLTEVDEQGYSVTMEAEGAETGGGTAKGSMVAGLRSLDGERTEVATEARIDITGRVMQVGRGMIKGVAHQLFLKFVQEVRRELEEAERGEAGLSSPPSVRRRGELSLLPLLLETLWAAIIRLLRRAAGKGRAFPFGQKESGLGKKEEETLPRKGGSSP